LRLFAYSIGSDLLRPITAPFDDFGNFSCCCRFDFVEGQAVNYYYRQADKKTAFTYRLSFALAKVNGRPSKAHVGYVRVF
jgi:hypothetical protein